MKRFNGKSAAAIVVLIFLLVVLALTKKYWWTMVDSDPGKSAGESALESGVGDAHSRLMLALRALGYGDSLPGKIMLVAFKEERVLQVYVKDVKGVRLLKAYPFTAYSGILGPKLKEGDKQIPEGIYEVEYLNPNSKYHLSMKIDYPNAFDKSKTTFSDYADMGGDIFIHGKAATIGCIPIGDEAIEEVYLLTQHALKHGVRVIISPRDFRVNSQYPVIEGILWEEELYDSLVEVLREIPY
ncbi:MAG: L,D-transpeptidase family protein [Flavobacteriales bacterium]|nr:L,D-transpeptidase family protein [Flavobacteriales bacterium]